MRIVAPMPQEGGPRIPKNPIFLKNGKNHQKRKNSESLEVRQNQHTPFDQRSLIHREAWFLGGPRIPKNPSLKKNRKNYPKRKNSTSLEICQNQRYALQPVVFNPSGSVVSTMFCKAKSAKNKLFFARRFQTTFKQKCSNLRPLLSITFPQGFRISKTIGHPTLGGGGRKTFKWYLKS